MSRPPIPKRLASRLRAIYAKVADARGHVAFAEAKILDCTLHIQEYGADPALFARLHYPFTDGPDSYPVQTNIARTRAAIEHKIERMPIYLEAVAAAEAKMAIVEKEVLDTLSAMREETLGRIEWPSEPMSLESYRKSELREFKLNRERNRRNLLRQNQKHELEVARAKEKAEAFERETDRIIEVNLANMEPTKAAVYRKVFEALRGARASGDFGAAQIVALASSDSSAFEPILESAKRLLEQEKESSQGSSASGA